MKQKSTKNRRNILVPTLDWQKVHPMGVVCKSDPYYARLSTKVANLIRNMIGEEYDILDEEIKEAAIEIVAYFEDKINGINLYNAFIKLYRERFNRCCPFYDCNEEDWFEDEPNLPDIRFLLWRGINRVNPDTILNPLNKGVEMIAESIYDLLMDEFETAPDSPEFFDALYDSEIFKDVLSIRALCGWIASRSYLTAVYDMESCFEEMFKVYSTQFADADEGLLAYAVESYFCFNVKCGPLALTPQKWLGEMLRLSDKTSMKKVGDKISAIDTFTLLPYEITKVNQGTFEVKAINGETLKLSFDPLPEETWADVKMGHVMISSLFKYDGLWKVNGMTSFTRNRVSTDQQIEEYIEKRRNLDCTFEIEMDKNGRHRMGVAKDFKELESRFDLDKATDRSTDLSVKKDVEQGKYLLYFINTDSSISMIPDRARYVALPDNPYYDRALAEKYSALLIIENNSTEEMRDYLLANNLLPDARLKGPLPDAEAKEWFAANAPFLSILLHTDEVEFNFPPITE